MTNSVQPVKPGLHTSEFHPTVRVQDDLFRFTNGTWIDSFEMPADQSTYGSFMLLRDLSEERVKAIIEDAAANPKPGVSQQIGDMYASFMNEQRANELGVAPIAADLKKISELGSIAEVTELLGELSAAGSDVLFGMYIDNDPGNPERYLVNIYQGGLGLPDEAYYHEEKHAEVRDAYVPFIAEMLELAGWSAADADAAAERSAGHADGIPGGSLDGRSTPRCFRCHPQALLHDRTTARNPCEGNPCGVGRRP